MCARASPTDAPNKWGYISLEKSPNVIEQSVERNNDATRAVESIVYDIYAATPHTNGLSYIILTHAQTSPPPSSTPTTIAPYPSYSTHAIYVPDPNRRTDYLKRCGTDSQFSTNYYSICNNMM